MADVSRIRTDANGARRQGSGGARRRSRSPVDRSKGRREDSRERHREGGGNAGHPCRILVKNLPYETKWQIIKDIFRKEVGDVTFVDVLEGADGRSKGVAMIEFKTKELAKKAIEKMHKFKVGDREIVVREERERDRALFENQRDREEMGRAMEMRGREMEMGLRGMDMGRMGMDMGRGAMDMGRGGIDLARDLDMGRGLDMGLRGGMDMGLRGEMGMGMGLPSVGLGSLGGLGVNSGMGGGMGMGGAMGMGGGGLMQGGGGGTVHSDINPEILAQLGIEGPITSQVFVANLDYKVTRSKLKEVFALAGKVVHAELKEDKTGKSRGLGIVEFETPLEAVQAVSMFNGQVLFDRKMMVRIDKAIEDKNISKLPSGLKSIGMGLGSGGAPLTNINTASSLAMSGGLGGLGMAGVGLGMDTIGGMGGSLGGVSGMGGSLGGVSGISGLQGIGSGLNSMGLGGSAAGLGGSGIGLGQASAGLGLGGSGLGLGFGDSMGGGGLGGSKVGMGDNLGMSGLGGSGMGLGMGGGMGSGGTMGGGGLGGSLDMQGSRVGYEGSRFDQPGGRVSRFDDNRSFDSKRGLDMGSRSSMDMQGRVGLEGGGRGGYDIGRGNVDAGVGMGRSGIDMPSQNRFDNVGRGGIEGDMRGGFENNRGGMGGLDMGRGGFDQIMRGSGNFDLSPRGSRDLGGRGDMGGRVDIGMRGDMSGRGDMRGGRQPRTAVLVKNLPFSIGLQTLRERFRDIGDLKNVEILTDMGRPSGEALLRFGAEEDALRAINLADGSRLEGRTIRVMLQS